MELIKLHKEVFLTTSIFFFNKIPFFLTLSRKICFTAVNHLADRTIPTIFKAFKEMYQYYLQRGFHIKTVHADGKFAPLKPLIESMPGDPMVNLASANEHVTYIERIIRVVKEWCRETWHSLPYERIPKLMTIHIVLNVVKLLNFPPTKGGVSDTLIPKTIMSGETLDFKKHLSLVHGFEFWQENCTMQLGRDPYAGCRNQSCQWFGKGQPRLMTFMERHGRLIGDMEIPGVDSTEDEDDYFPEVAPVIADAIEIPGVDVAGTEALDEVPAPQVDIYDPDDIPHDDPAPIEVVPAQAVPAPAPVAPLAETGLHRSTRVRTQESQGYTPSMTGSKYSYAVTQLESQGVLYSDAHMCVQDDFYQAEPDVVAAIMTQLLLKAGLKEWDKKGFKAAHSEMNQLHLRKTFKPKHWRELSKAQRQTVMESHMFLKLKRDGKIKGRTFAGGNKQRNYISKENASSTTVATESVLLSCIIDAEEHRDVTVVDIPNAFVQTRVENKKDMAFIKIRGTLVEILVEIAPEAYKSYVSQDKKGNKQLLVQC
jgi:hypothetical protein